MIFVQSIDRNVSKYFTIHKSSYWFFYSLLKGWQIHQIEYSNFDYSSKDQYVTCGYKYQTNNEQGQIILKLRDIKKTKS